MSKGRTVVSVADVRALTDRFHCSDAEAYHVLGEIFQGKGPAEENETENIRLTT